MLKVDQATMDRIESQHPGIIDQIRGFEEHDLPPCSNCGSKDTAVVQCGIIGRTMRIASVATKVHLIANGPKPGRFFCNACEEYFG